MDYFHFYFQESEPYQVEKVLGVKLKLPYSMVPQMETRPRTEPCSCAHVWPGPRHIVASLNAFARRWVIVQAHNNIVISLSCRKHRPKKRMKLHQYSFYQAAAAAIAAPATDHSVHPVQSRLTSKTIVYIVFVSPHRLHLRKCRCYELSAAV